MAYNKKVNAFTLTHNIHNNHNNNDNHRTNQMKNRIRQRTQKYSTVDDVTMETFCICSLLFFLNSLLYDFFVYIFIDELSQFGRCYMFSVGQSMTHYCLDLFLFHLTIYFLFFNTFYAHHFRRVYFYSSTASDIRAYIAHKRITINWLTLVYVSDERASTYKSFRLNGNCFHIMASILHAQPKNIYVIINIFFFVAFLFQN